MLVRSAKSSLSSHKNTFPPCRAVTMIRSRSSSLLRCAVLLSSTYLVASTSSNALCAGVVSNQSGNCVVINNWSDLFNAFSSTSNNGQLFLCGYDIEKAPTDEMIVVQSGIQVACVPTDSHSECISKGRGTHLRIATSDDTFFQGLSFAESDNYAVHLVSQTQGSSSATHTFCSVALEDNERTSSSRGGAFMIERYTGTVNIVDSRFESNFSQTYGAAIYTRGNTLNVIDTYFGDNIASGWGGAIFCAADATLMVQGSSFERNYGRNGYGVAVNPRSGTGSWIDGTGNTSSDEPCSGFFNIDDSVCEDFIHVSAAPSESTPGPTSSTSPTTSPSSSLSPSVQPTPGPTNSPTSSHVPTSAPTGSPAPTSVADTLCTFDAPDEPCMEVSNYNEFKAAIEGSDKVYFCGGFRIRKPSVEPIVISSSTEIRCRTLCSIYGKGTHFQIHGGEDTHVRMQGLKLMSSDNTAVQVMPGAVEAATTFCQCQFWDNKASDEIPYGGAINIQSGDGVVNVVDCYFSRNEALRGGAIYSQSYMLNVVDTKFVMNVASGLGTAIFVDSGSHILIRSSLFGLNKLTTVSTSSSGFAIVVQPEAAEDVDHLLGVHVDGGGNVVAGSGQCEGYFIISDGQCNDFDIDHAQPLIYPYIRGDLGRYDGELGIKYSTGLRVRLLAKSGEAVKFTSPNTDVPESSVPFHSHPNGAGTFRLLGGGWTYLSNADLANGKGGAFAVDFDADGEIVDYQPRLQGTSRNNNGGATPFRTWISCEVKNSGHCWQVDPTGEREPEITILGGPDGGKLESFATDFRDPFRPVYFVSEDSTTGALRRVQPGVQSQGAGWDSLTQDGTMRQYLVLDPDTNTFSWTSDIDEGRASAAAHYPHSEGLSVQSGILHMTSKDLSTIFSLNLSTRVYTSHYTKDAILDGDGTFEEEGDQLTQISDQTLYIGENGGSSPGLYALDLHTDSFYAIFEGISDVYNGDDVTGIAFSPDWRRLYAAFENSGILLEFVREDGLTFEDP